MGGKEIVRSPEELAKKAREESFDLQPADNIVEIARQAEERIEAVKKIKSLVLRMTNNMDWVDEGGRPYLQSSGAEKVAGLFGLSWKNLVSEKKVLPKGHYFYKYTGDFSAVSSNASRTIEAVGTRSSSDKFLCKGKTPEEVDEANVMKSAYSNCLANGITRLLGIRNITMQELAEAGIHPGSKVEFKKGGNSAPKTAGGNDNRKATEKQVNFIKKKAKGKGLPADALSNHLEMEGVKDIKDLPIGKVNKLLEWIDEQAKEMKKTDGKESLV